MNILLMGPPGAGKGTQAELIVSNCNIPHISTGEMFRKAIAEETELGLLAKQIVAQGGLVPDDVTAGIVKARLSEADCNHGFLLDGYPRNVEQAKTLDDILASLGRKIDHVINIDVNMDQLKLRLMGRRLCKSCGATYHIAFNPPAEAGKCDKCGHTLYQREDDKEDKVATRLSVYTAQTQPLIAYYESTGILTTINGLETIDVVFQNIQVAIKGRV